MAKAPVSDESVKRATGRDWSEWCRVLDRAGAARLTHAEIARVVHDKFEGGDWWSQMVTVGYERLRGMRTVNERPDGFEINRSKTIAAPIARIYDAWHALSKRRTWLRDPGFEISTATPLKTVRFTWIDGKTRAAASFAAKGDKTVVTVTHMKIKDAKAAEKLKKYWTAQLAALAKAME